MSNDAAKDSIFGNAIATVSYAEDTMVVPAGEWEAAVDALLAKHGPFYGRPDVQITTPAPQVEADAVTIPAPAKQAAPRPTARRIKRSRNGRVRSIVRDAEPEELEWDPELVQLLSAPIDAKDEELNPDDIVAGYAIAGGMHAIVRRGYRRDPFGIVGHSKTQYVPVSHRRTIANIKAACGDVVTQDGPARIDGVGAHVVHHFAINHLAGTEVCGVTVGSKLTVVHDNTGSGATGSSLQVTIDGLPCGTIYRSRGVHVASAPERWQGTVSAHVERAILAQDALRDIVEALAGMVWTKDWDAFFAQRNMRVMLRIENGNYGEYSMLDAVRRWHQPTTGDMSWSRFERSLEDDMLRTVCLILPASFGNNLDAALGYRQVDGTPYKGRFGRDPRIAALKAAAEQQAA